MCEYLNVVDDSPHFGQHSLSVAVGWIDGFAYPHQDCILMDAALFFSRVWFA
jgi:hypothetical protein